VLSGGPFEPFERFRYCGAMAITPPLSDHEPFNQLANRLASQLSSAFGYTLPEAEEHIRNFYVDYERSMPERRRYLKESGVQLEPLTTEDVFGMTVARSFSSLAIASPAAIRMALNI
jgi:hypothetical protein